MTNFKRAERVLTGTTDVAYASVKVDLVTGATAEVGDTAAATVLKTWRTLATYGGTWAVSLPVTEDVTPAGTHYVVTEYGTSTVVSSCTVARGTTALVLEDIAGTVATPTPTLAGITMADGANVVLNATTGTKIGTATTQKLSFYNATPVTRPTALTAADASTVDGTYGAAEAAVVENLRTRVGELETKLQALGLLA